MFEKGRNTCRKCRAESRRIHPVSCKNCGEIFKSAKKNAVFCGRSCSGQFRRERVIVICAYCNNEKEVIPSLVDRIKDHYCDQECRTKHMRIIMVGENNPNYSRIEKPCDGCGVLIKVIPSEIKNLNNNFCSYLCYKENIGRFYSGENNNNWNRETYKCANCKTSFERIPSASRGKEVYCSKSCYLSTMDERERKAEIDVNCVICDKTIKVWRSRLNHVTRVHCSKACANLGNSVFYSGENSPNWDHSLTEEERLTARNYKEYHNWRNKVFSRDQYTCKCCGDSRGGNLVAHHIYNYSEHEELRTCPDNGVTLCETCHVGFHKRFGYRENNKEQLIEYITKHKDALAGVSF